MQLVLYASSCRSLSSNPRVGTFFTKSAPGLSQERRQALKDFQRVLNEFPESMSARDALSFSAGAYNRLKRTDQAIAAYKRYGDKYADGPNPERPFLNIIDTLHEAGRHQEALQWVQQMRTRFRTGIGGTLALFRRFDSFAQSAGVGIADAKECRSFGLLVAPAFREGRESEIIFLRPLRGSS